MQTISISNNGTGALNWTASDNATWLSLSSTSGTAPASVNVTVNISGLSAGTYTGQITIQADGAQGSPETVTVTLTIAPPDTYKIYLPIVLVPPPQITNLEVNQSIQTLDNRVPLIANRPGVVRAYVNKGGFFQSRLHGIRNGAVLPNSPILSTKSTISGPSGRDNLDSTLNFNLPVEWRSGSIQVYAELLNASTGEVLSRYPNNGYVTLNFGSANVLRVRFVPVIYNGVMPDTQMYAEIQNALYKTYPLGQPPIIETRPPLYFYGDLSTDDGWENLLDAVTARKQSEDRNGPWYYYGLVNAGNNTKWAGIGWLTIRASVGYDRSYYAADTAIHEIGHNHGRRHAPCGNPDDIDPNWPYASNPNAQISEYGYDILDNHLISPQAKDFMSYCDNEWVTIYTYNGLRNRNIGIASLDGQANRPVMLVSGLIDTDGGSLGQIYYSDGVPSSPDSQSDYRLEFFSVEEKPLYSHPFTPIEITSLGQTAREAIRKGFLVAVPRFENLGKIELWHGQTLLDELLPNALQVGTQSVPTIEWRNNNLVFKWNAPSQDQFYRIYSSRSGKDNWTLIADNITQTEFSLDTTLLPGGQTWFKVSVSNGLHESEQIIGPVTIPDKAPVVFILLPNPQVQYQAGTPIELQSTVFDLEDGTVPEEAITWQLDGQQVAFGLQATLNSTNLNVGEHLLVLSAQDSAGNLTEEKVILTIR
ncbi:MAG: hypothetical protein D6732_00765 [Methanobacteriota archaeon]|nr:MAG: hypothetical protein D6732_00765 [Euryarchaeota archaeon]